MHIPDGFVSPATAAVTYVASGAAVAYAARRANATLGAVSYTHLTLPTIYSV